MIKNYKVDFSGTPHEELQLLTTRGSQNTWRVYFDSFEHEDERTSETIKVAEVVQVEEEVKNPETGETETVLVEKTIEKEKVIETRVYESKYVEVTKPKDEIVTALGIIKNLILEEISEYDTSPEINSFYLNDEEVWLDRDTRVSIMNSTTIQKNAGLETTTLWFDGVALVIDCDNAIQLLGGLEIYALNCFNKTAEHKSKVEELNTIAEIINYDYTVGYPEKLNINI